MFGGHLNAIAATANVAFLLAFPSLFSIINPIGGALIFSAYTRAFSHPDRLKIAGLVGVYALAIMFCALWGGAYVLSFFGVSIDALRIAGGAVVALSGWHLLNSGDQHPDRKTATSSRRPATPATTRSRSPSSRSPSPSPPGPARSRSRSPWGPSGPRTAPRRSPSSSA